MLIAQTKVPAVLSKNGLAIFTNGINLKNEKNLLDRMDRAIVV